jgi:hypothetical protein
VEPTPETRYAQTADGGQVAYQVAGSGPTLMLGFSPLAVIDLMWEEPTIARFLDRLSAFTRHAWFDPRGAGSSSSRPSGRTDQVESVTDDSGRSGASCFAYRPSPPWSSPPRTRPAPQVLRYSTRRLGCGATLVTPELARSRPNGWWRRSDASGAPV